VELGLPEMKDCSKLRTCAFWCWYDKGDGSHDTGKHRGGVDMCTCPKTASATL
jgi:hypothetical protein